jgi:DNA segregation ATPase FtsK/SpoIIIE, S-DNA-T family
LASLLMPTTERELRRVEAANQQLESTTARHGLSSLGRPIERVEGPLGLPHDRVAAVEHLLRERLRLWGELALADRAQAHLEALVAGAGLAPLEIPVPPLSENDDARRELDARCADAQRHVDRVGALREDIRSRQHALDQVGGLRRKRKRADVIRIVATLRAQSEAERHQLATAEAYGVAAADAFRRRTRRALAATGHDLTQTDRALATEATRPWDLGRWEGWRPAGGTTGEELRVGRLREEPSGVALDVPLVVPFIGHGRAIVITSRGADQHAQGAALLQSLVLRTAAMLPQQARYTLLDPAGNGLAFPMARNLPRTSVGTGDIRRDLDEVTREIQRVIRTYLDPSRPTFEDIPDEMRLAENYHFVCVADFPNGYDVRAAEALQNIARTGPRAGVYVIMHVDADRQRQVRGDIDRFGIENPWQIDVGETRITTAQLSGSVVFDDAPSASLQESIFHRLKSVPSRDRAINWDDLHPANERDWWQESSEQLISAPIGRHGANELLNVWFGTDQWLQRPCVHGVLGAMPGAGKSTLFHNLITGLAIRYSPRELQFLLIDGKFGVEFQPYVALPHASVVSLRTSPALSRSVLADAVAEMGRRNAMFTRAGVVDLPGYRRKGQPDGNLPRLLVLVDEYQQLFDGDRDGEASANLLRLSQQGRSSGIHLLLASQRFDTAGMLHRADIFGNMHLRIAMQLAQADAATLIDFGVKGRRLISATCDRVGRMVMNECAGDDEANVAGKAAMLTPHRRDEIIKALAHKAVLSGDSANQARTVVFDGQAQPDLLDNPHIRELSTGGTWPDVARMEAFARGERDGLGVADWLAAERPVAFFLGQEFNVRGHAAVVLRRRRAEHLLVVGERHDARLGLLSAALISAALVEAPVNLAVWVNDRSVERTPWSSALASAVDTLSSLGYVNRFGRSGEDAANLINDATVETQRRAGLSEAVVREEPTILLVLNEPDRVTSLQRTPDDIGRSESLVGAQLGHVLALGPSLGIHVLLAASSVGLLRSVLADRVVQAEFRHRVVLQMPEDDSFGLVRSAAAARLQAEGPRPIAALVYDHQQQRATRFKPYCLWSEADGTSPSNGDSTLLRQVTTVARQLAGRLV